MIKIIMMDKVFFFSFYLNQEKKANSVSSLPSISLNESLFALLAFSVSGSKEKAHNVI